MCKQQRFTVERFNEIREYMIDHKLYPHGYDGKIPISIPEKTATPENIKAAEDAGYEVFIDTRCPDLTLEGTDNYTLMPGYMGKVQERECDVIDTKGNHCPEKPIFFFKHNERDIGLCEKCYLNYLIGSAASNVR